MTDTHVGSKWRKANKIHMQKSSIIQTDLSTTWYKYGPCVK